MGNFERKYSQDQHRAVQNAKINEQLTYARIEELAAQGKLYGLKPFTMKRSAMEKTVAAERKRRRIADYHPEAIDPTTASVDIHKWLQSQVCAERDDIAQKIRTGQLKGEELRSALRDLAKTQIEVDRLQAKPSPTAKPPKDGKAQEKPERKPSPTLAAITKSAKAKRPATANLLSTGREDGERDAGEAQREQASKEEIEVSGRVPSRDVPASLAGAVPLEEPESAPTVAESVA